MSWVRLLFPLWGIFFLCLPLVVASTSEMMSAEGAFENCRKPGGQFVQGKVRISPVAERKDEAVHLSMTGADVKDWFPENPFWDSQTVENGRYELNLQEHGANYSGSMIVNNNSNVVIHGGVLKQDEIWESDKVHIVKYWVRVPEGTLLSFRPGTVVKFCSDVGIFVQGALHSVDAHLLSVRDDSIGGDTDGNGIVDSPGEKDWRIEGTGHICIIESHLSESKSVFKKMDFRDGFGAQLVHGEVYIAPINENMDYRASLILEGKNEDSWNWEESLWNSGQVQDGQRNVALKEQERIMTRQLTVLNDSGVNIHGGLLTENEKWTADKEHIVQYWLRIPEGRTLTIDAGTVVKFCAHTGILVDAGGSLVVQRAFLTTDDDNSIGRILSNGNLTEHGSYEITGAGTVNIYDSLVKPMYGDLVWGKENVHVIFGKLTVPSGKTLLIQPGAVVKFASGAELHMEENGKIVCEETIFTHLADDTVGGDTGNDGDLSKPSNGAYSLTGFAPPDSCDLRYIDWLYVGWNLFALSGYLTDCPVNRDLLHQYNAMVYDDSVYHKVSPPLNAGVALWLYSRKSQNAGFVYDSDHRSAPPKLSDAWNLRGLSGKLDEWLPDTHADLLWEWKKQHFEPVLKEKDRAYHLFPGRGYFIHSGKAEP